MQDKRRVCIIFQDQAKTEFDELKRIAEQQIASGETNSDEIRLLNSIFQKMEQLKTNPLCGNKIQRKLIPRGLDAPNLFRLTLTGYWRMLYSVRFNEIEIVAFILYIMDHRAYDQLFGYGRK